MRDCLCSVKGKQSKGSKVLGVLREVTVKVGREGRNTVALEVGGEVGENLVSWEGRGEGNHIPYTFSHWIFHLSNEQK